MLLRLAVLAALMIFPSMAQAQWHRAESKNFIVVGDRPAEEIRDSIVKMEKFAFVLRSLSGRDIKDTPSKIKIHLVRDIAAVGRTFPGGGGYGVAGYYMPSIRPYLVTPRMGRGARDGRGLSKSAAEKGDNHDIVFYHELTHHFMFQYFSAAYPTWYSEAFAEFYGTFTIEETPTTDRVEIGASHEWRLRQLRFGNWIPMTKILSARSYADIGQDIGNLYSQGWLFQHYAANNKVRNAQLKKYLELINAGTAYDRAATQAFGDDLKLLDRELQAYMRRPTIDKFVFPFKKIDVGPVELRRMTPVESDMWLTDLQLSGAVPKDHAGQLRTNIRAGAAKYPDEPFALAQLTAIERLTGNRAEAQAAVTRWLAIAPNDPIALMQRGGIAIDGLKADKVAANDPRWEAARDDILAANRLAPEDPVVLKEYYDSFAAAGLLPPAAAQNALMSAMNIAPQVSDLRQQVANDFEAREMYPEAMAVIRPLAFRMKPDSELTPEERRRRDKAKGYFLNDPEYENPREMYDRLEKKLEATQADGSK